MSANVARICATLLVAILLWPAGSGPVRADTGVTIAQSHVSQLSVTTSPKQYHRRMSGICAGACVANCSVLGALISDPPFQMTVSRSAAVPLIFLVLENYRVAPRPHPPRPIGIG